MTADVADSEPTLTPRNSRWGLAASMLWGIVLSLAVCRMFFLLGHGQFFLNHDANGYGLRLIEFRDCVWNGVLFPQWCFHFRGGLGSPYFNYYQPGFFYAASLTPSGLPLAQQLGWTLAGYSLAGYCGMLALVGRRCSVVAGTLAGTFLLTAPYIHTELYMRGDFSEYAAMMLTPGFLAALLRYCERPTRWAGFFGATLAAMIVMTHPAIALVLYGLIAVILAGAALSRASLFWAIRGFTLLALGAGLSAVYWFPVFQESRYASVEKMWDGQILEGYYHYSRHFLQLSWLLNDSVESPAAVPVKLGLCPTLVTVLGLLVVAKQWQKRELLQRHTAAVCLFLLCGSLYLMSSSSAWLWDSLPLLGRIQFPWRLMSLVSITMAGLAGLAMFAFEKRGQRACVLGLLCVLLVWPAMTRARPQETHFQEPRSAQELADQFFAPDFAGEWLPRGAKGLQIDPRTRQVLTNPPATVRDYQIRQGALECTLRTEQKTSVLLPHYDFPVGFSATLNGQTVPISRSPIGFMRIDVPANFQGVLRVVWQMTNAKRQGALISLLVALAGAGWLIAHRQQPHVASELGESDHD